MWFACSRKRLQRLGSEDNPLTAKVLASLALALGVMGQQQQAMVYAEKAVAMARRFDDPVCWSPQPSSDVLCPVTGPEHAEQRLIVANQLLEASQGGDTRQNWDTRHTGRAHIACSSLEIWWRPIRITTS